MAAITWILISTLFGAMLWIVLQQRRTIRELRSRNERTSDWIETLRRERPALVKMAQHPEEDETRQLIRKRYQMMADLLAAGVSDDTVRINSAWDELTALVSERESFMRETRLIHERLQPVLMAHLHECGLSDREIEICCLYALGINGKTIQQYTRDGRHFQHVGLIRKKLGLSEHDKNIDGYIRSLLR